MTGATLAAMAPSRKLPARVRALGTATRDALLALLLAVATLVEMAFEDLGDQPGLIVVSGVLLALLLAPRRRAALPVVLAQWAVVLVQSLLGGDLFDVAFVPFLSAMFGLFTLAVRHHGR